LILQTRRRQEITRSLQERGGQETSKFVAGLRIHETGPPAGDHEIAAGGRRSGDVEIRCWHRIHESGPPAGDHEIVAGERRSGDPKALNLRVEGGGFEALSDRARRKVWPALATNDCDRSSVAWAIEAGLDNTRVDSDFLSLLNQYRGAIERVSRMYTSGVSEREELVQEIVYQLWRALPSYRRESAPLTWVYRIAINSAITGLRRRARRPTHVSLEAAADIASPPTAVGNDPQADLLYRAIRRLGDVDRALVMCYLDDLSYREIADVLGLSETNVGARLSRTKARLQNLVRSME
jgi:RNA polymerase sigma-70 factor (ECF subfamily)